MKPIFVFALPIILLSCGGKHDNQENLLFQRDQAVNQALDLHSGELDARAIAVLKDPQVTTLEFSNLNQDYFFESYRFHTKEGRRELVKLITDDVRTDAEVKKLFRLLISQFSSTSSDINELMEYLEQLNDLKNEKVKLKQLPLNELIFVIGLNINKDLDRDQISIEENHQYFSNLASLIIDWDEGVIFSFISKAFEVHYLDLIKHEQFYRRADFSLSFLINSFVGYVREGSKSSEPLSEDLQDYWMNKFQKLVQNVEKRAFASILTQKVLMPPRKFLASPTNPNSINMQWDMRHSASPLGGCAGHGDSVKGINLEGGNGRSCNYSRSGSTATQYNIAHRLKSEMNHYGALQIEAMIGSSIKGGHATRNGTRGSKDHTVQLDYSANGRVEIPVCQNIIECNPIVQVSNEVPDDGGMVHFTSFSKKSPQGSAQSVRVNGEELRPGETRFIDRSENPIEIVVSLSRKDQHTGACCNSSSEGQQRILLRVYGIENFPKEVMHSTLANTFSNPFAPELTANPVRYNIVGHGNRNQLTEVMLNYIDSDKNEVVENLGLDETMDDVFYLPVFPVIGLGWRLDFDNSMNQSKYSYLSTLYGTLDLIDYVKRERSDQLDWIQARSLYLLEDAIEDYSRQRVIPILNERIVTLKRFAEMNFVKALEVAREEFALALELKRFELLTSTSKRLQELASLMNVLSVPGDSKEKIEGIFTSVNEDQIEGMETNLRLLDKVIDEVRSFQDEVQLDLELSISEMAQYEK